YTSSFYGDSSIQFGQIHADSFSPQMTINHRGKVSVGPIAPVAATLEVNHVPDLENDQDYAFFVRRADGSGNMLSMRTFTTGGPFNLELFEGEAYKPGGGAWSVVSDRRLKKNIEPLSGALDRLLQLRSVTYEYKDPEKSHQLPGIQTGFIAQ